MVCNNLTLTAENLPQNQFGMFLCSEIKGFVPNPGSSQGNLCLAGSIGRYNRPGEIKNSGAEGTYSLVLDLTDTPQPTGSVSIMAGETWNFQTWFRDANPGSTSNFTDGVSILFLAPPTVAECARERPGSDAGRPSRAGPPARAVLPGRRARAPRSRPPAGSGGGR